MRDNYESLELLKHKYLMTLYWLGWCDLLTKHTHEHTHTHTATQIHKYNSELYDWSTDTADWFTTYFCLNRFVLTTHLQEFINFIEEMHIKKIQWSSFFITHIYKVNFVECFNPSILYIIESFTFARITKTL